MTAGSMAARVGTSATINRKPRQARKGATVAAKSGAGELLARAVSLRLGPSYKLDGLEA